ncbi:MAG: segregation/condensation protein A, partial [Pseudomonadota bacterium]
VRQRMSDILSSLTAESFVPFETMFSPEEGRMGATVTFIALLELLKERLIDVVQSEAFSPIHIRGTNASSSDDAQQTIASVELEED